MGLQSRPKRKVDFIVTGSSNASGMAKALDEGGHSVCKIFQKNWRINRANCEESAPTIKQEDPAVAVLQLLDGSEFYTRYDDGSRMLPRKLQDGQFHIEGELASSHPTQLIVSFYCTS
jgi:hypothetical protein